MKVKKAAAYILAGAAAVSSIGCGSTTNGSTQAGAESAKGKQEKDGSQEVVEIRFTEWDGGNTLSVYEEIADKFNASHPNIHVTAMNIPNEYDTKITAMIAGNDTPEVCCMNGDTLLFPLAEQGIILNMQDYIDHDASFDQESIGKQFKYMLSADYFAGYGVGSENICMFYNPELFEKYGVKEPPASYEHALDWPAFIDTARRLTIDRNGRNALDPQFDSEHIDVYGATISKWWAGYLPFMLSYGQDYLAKDGTAIGYATSEGEKALQNLADLTYLYHVAPTPTASDTMPGLSEALATNKVAMSIDGQWSNATLMDDGVAYNVAALPKMGDEAKTVATYGAIALMNTPKADAAFQFIKFILTEKGACESLFKSGLWLPTNMKEYREDYIKSIITDKHPDNYYESIVKPMVDKTAAPPAPLYVKNFNRINDIITPALDDLWSGEKTAKEAISSIEEEANEQVQGFYGK